jgi:hypothetical protein
MCSCLYWSVETTKFTSPDVHWREVVKLLSVEKDRGVLFIIDLSSQVFKVQTKVFMRGNAVNKHLSVGFWDLVGVRSLWEGRCHQRLLSPTFKTYPKSKRDNYERVGAIIILWLSTTCNREHGHSTRQWIIPCQAQGRGFSPFLLGAEAPEFWRFSGRTLTFIVGFCR